MDLQGFLCRIFQKLVERGGAPYITIPEANTQISTLGEINKPKPLSVQIWVFSPNKFA